MNQNYSIIGVTIYGNMGGQAMLRATIQEITKRSPSANFTLFSIYGKQDTHLNQFPNLRVVNCNPIHLILLYLPLALLTYPIRSLRSVQWLIKKIPFFEIISNSTGFIDLGGITFIDKRGIPLIAYNFACSFIPLVVNTPSYKLSQAMGPFKTPSNRIAAKFITRKMNAVVARGKKTFEHLKQLHPNGKNLHQFYDTAFSCELSDEDGLAGEKYLSENNLRSGFITISPSRVVQRICKKSSIDLERVLILFIKHLIADGHEVLLLPHSLGDGKSKNNDIDICRKIHEKLSTENLHLIEVNQNANVLRYIISKSSVFIGCRFHSIVAALSTGTPTLTIGWSHKYLEMVEPFDQSEFVLKNEELSLELLVEKFNLLFERKEKAQETIKMNLVHVKESSRKNFDLVATSIR